MSPKDPEKSPYQARLASKLFKQLCNPCLPPQLPYCPDGKAMTRVELYRKSTVAMFRIQRRSPTLICLDFRKSHINHQQSINDLGMSLPPPPRTGVKPQSECLVCRQSPSLATTFALLSSRAITNYSLHKSVNRFDRYNNCR